MKNKAEVTEVPLLEKATLIVPSGAAAEVFLLALGHLLLWAQPWVT